MARLRLLNAKSRSLGTDSCASRWRLVASVTATQLQKRGPGQASSTRGFRDMKSPESSTQSAQASPDGHQANGSESAGMADTAAAAILAVAATSLPAKSPSKCPASRTTEATPNTLSLPPARLR